MKMKKITVDTIISRTKEIVSSDIDGETVMMSIENGKYYGLDHIASRIWELIENPIKVSDLIDALLARYEVDRKSCERDVFLLLNELDNNKILTIEG
jgi:hypothetical protein